ncbi:MAG: VOC family protein [Chloroflexi bacterium]|nr:VOC family protein [Chloroflexota bacterium]
MERPRIRHIALNVQNRDKEADYYKKVFGMEEKSRGPNGTIYLSDGHVGVALISRSELPWGINHFGFQVESINQIEESAQTTAVANSAAAVGEHMIYDAEGYRVDLSVEGWPI